MSRETLDHRNQHKIVRAQGDRVFLCKEWWTKKYQRRFSRGHLIVTCLPSITIESRELEAEHMAMSESCMDVLLQIFRLLLLPLLLLLIIIQYCIIID
jgi:uncharacterized protein (DUF488 family)